MVAPVNSRDVYLQASLTRTTNNSLMREEKPGFINLYNQILDTKIILDAQAVKYNITTQKIEFDSAVTALTDYLATLTIPVLWSDTSNITLFSSRDFFNSKFTDVYNAKTTLELEIGKRTDVAGYLTVSSIVLTADSFGVVADFAPSKGVFNVTSGAYDVTGLGPVYSLVSTTALSVTINAVSGAYATTAMSVGVGKAVLRAVYGGKTIDLTYTVIKGGVGASGTAYRTCYMASTTAAPASTPNPQTDASSTTTPGSGTVKWGLTGTWGLVVVALNTGEFLYQSDGIYNPETNQTTWSVPYWSSLRVGSISAITADLGTITAGSISSVDITSSTLQTATSGKRISIYANSYIDQSMAGEMHVWDDLGGGLEEIASIGRITALGDYVVGKFGTLTVGNACRGIYAMAYQSDAVMAVTTKGTGVLGQSSFGFGVYGKSETSSGVFGNSTGTGIGVYGKGDSGGGVFGDSISGIGGSFGTRNNTGVYGQSINRNGIEAYAGLSTQYDFKAVGVGINGPFTGAHDGMVLKPFTASIGDIMVDESIFFRQSVSNAVCVNALSSSAKQINVLGVVSGISDKPDMDEITALQTWGDARTLNSAYTRVVINSLGEGLMNVCKDGGDILAGDFICSSSRAGKGMKQDDDLFHSYTVAKSRESCAWAAGEDNIRMIACTYHCG